MADVVGVLRFLPPVRLVFLASLLLSAVAIFGAGTVSRDATLYFDAAQAFLDHGLNGAFAIFDWPWFSILLAVSHWLTGIPIETCAYLWCAVLMAGTCALLVDCCQRWIPGSGYLACLSVLAIPGFNQYRSEILREFGFWFFCVLALWLAGRWRECGGWLRASLIQLAILLAAIFRLEAVFLIPVLVLWQLVSWRQSGEGIGFLQLSALPVLGVAVAVLLVSVGDWQLARLEYYLLLVEPERLLGSFNQLAERLAEGMRFKYSRDDAGLIIFLGILGTLLVGFLASLGPLAVPLICTGRRAWRHIVVAAGQHFSWAWLGYFLVLLVFFVHNQFMISRYESLLSILAAPAVVLALRDFRERFPRLGRVLLVVAVLVMLDNVISLGARKTHFVAAGRWMATHVESHEPVYYDDVRISYYAGRGARRQPFARDVAMSPEHAGSYRYFFVEADADEPWLRDWLQQRNKRILTSFANTRGDTVLVLGD